jgi:hypothetical protein
MFRQRPLKSGKFQKWSRGSRSGMGFVDSQLTPGLTLFFFYQIGLITNTSSSFDSGFGSILVMALSLETISLPHLPLMPVHVALYRDVQNAAPLKSRLLAGQTEFEYAFIDASMVS